MELNNELDNMSVDLKKIYEEKKQENQDKMQIIDKGKEFDDFKQQSLRQIQDDFNNGKVDADTGMKQLVNILTIVEATADPKLRKTLQSDASKSLKSYMRSINYKDEENKLIHKQKRNEAFYKAFRPILEFDLSHLINKRRKKIVEKDNVTGKKIVRYEDIPEQPKKTYQDRSYGMTLMLIMIMLLSVPYALASIGLAIGKVINSLFESFEQFGKTAFIFSSCIAGITIIGIVVYIILLIVQSLFGVVIFK